MQAALELDPALLLQILFLGVAATDSPGPFPTHLLEDISFTLRIPAETEQMRPNLMNQVASHSAKLQGEVTVAGGCRRYRSDGSQHPQIAQLSDTDLNSLFFDTKHGKYQQDFFILKHHACDVKMQFPRPYISWTLQAFVDCILHLETFSRPKYNVFGRLDVQRIFFEGLTYSKADRAYRISWGS